MEVLVTESAGFWISSPTEPSPSLLSSVQLHRWNSRWKETLGVPHLGLIWGTPTFPASFRGSLQGHILTSAKLEWEINALSLADLPVGAFEPFPSTAGCFCAEKVHIVPMWFFSINFWGCKEEVILSSSYKSMQEGEAMEQQVLQPPDDLTKKVRKKSPTFTKIFLFLLSTRLHRHSHSLWRDDSGGGFQNKNKRNNSFTWLAPSSAEPTELKQEDTGRCRCCFLFPALHRLWDFWLCLSHLKNEITVF